VPARPGRAGQAGQQPPGEREQIGLAEGLAGGLVGQAGVFERGGDLVGVGCARYPVIARPQCVGQVVRGSAVSMQPRPRLDARFSRSVVAAGSGRPGRVPAGRIVATWSGYRRADHGHWSGTGGLTPVTGQLRQYALPAPRPACSVPPVGTREGRDRRPGDALPRPASSAGPVLAGAAASSVVRGAVVAWLYAERSRPASRPG